MFNRVPSTGTIFSSSFVTCGEGVKLQLTSVAPGWFGLRSSSREFSAGRAKGRTRRWKRSMTTDPLFYRLFETSPETFFLLLGIPSDAAKEMAARYQYLAIEFKETSHRTDGVFLPKEPDLPLYFVEVQF